MSQRRSVGSAGMRTSPSARRVSLREVLMYLMPLTSHWDVWNSPKVIDALVSERSSPPSSYRCRTYRSARASRSRATIWQA